MKKNLLLFLTFFKISSFTFGGGYSMIPFIQREISEKKKWISPSDILDIFAISGSLPGAISINCSTFIGFQVGGFIGAFFSTLGLSLPFYKILIVSYFGRLCHLYMCNMLSGNTNRCSRLIDKALYAMVNACPKSILAIY